jgi:hypothetical protein
MTDFERLGGDETSSTAEQQPLLPEEERPSQSQTSTHVSGESGDGPAGLEQDPEQSRTGAHADSRTGTHREKA